MSVRRKRRRTVGSLRPNVPRKKPSRKVLTASELSRRVEDVTDRLDIVLPEVTARVAALEHLLLKLNVCTRDGLRQARAFVKEQEE